ncbi:MAG: hypothetical protein Q4G09_05865, partial [Clostridia bacterium]|nr:hypothetical protein [Clostridia bacterium]
MEKKSVLSHINESILAFSRDYSLEEATYDNTNATEEQIAEFEKSDERVSKIIELLQKRNRTFGK